MEYSKALTASQYSLATYFNLCYSPFMQQIELTSVERAIRSVGSQKAVAALMGVKQASVARWKKTGLVPSKRVLGLERISGVSRTALRPDLYPAE